MKGGLRREFPHGPKRCTQLTRPDRYDWSMVDVDPVPRRRREFVPVECGIACRGERPRLGIGRRFARKVASVELGDGGIEVSWIEHDDRRDLIDDVDLDDAKYLHESLL